MVRRLSLSVLFALALVACTLGWVRGAWQQPLDVYAFDFSINYTGARLLEPFGADRPLYDRATLKAEAAPYTDFERLYTGMFLTYIQTPITAVITVPFAYLDFDGARLAFLVFSNALLVAAAAVMVYALRPSPLLVLIAVAIYGTYEPMYESLRLGQVDGIIVLCLALAFLGLRRGARGWAGVPLALASILKLSPVFIAGYCLTRRWWRLVLAFVATLVALGLLSLAVAGWHNNWTFVREMMPHLMRGSPWYYNISITGAVLRAWLGRGYWAYEDEPPALPPAARVALWLLYLAIVAGGYYLTRRDGEAGFMLAIAAGILISPVSWTFYVTWLIPSLLWLARRYEDRRAWGWMVALAFLYLLLAIKPDYLAEFEPDIHAFPLKALTLVLYMALIAREGVRSAVGTGSHGAGIPATATLSVRG